MKGTSGMTNMECVQSLNETDLATFIRGVYLAGKNGEGFSMFDYNLENWLKQEVNSQKQKSADG